MFTKDDIFRKRCEVDYKCMRVVLSRRELLLATLVAPLLKSETRTREARVQILEAVWKNARDLFYDPQMRGVDWVAVRDEFLPLAAASTSDDHLLSLLRAMLSRLRNSHIFLYTEEEWSWRGNVLPFCFDRVAGRVFVRSALHSRDSTARAALKFGDEVIAVDGISADELRPLTLARLEPIKGNPNFGPSGSTAEVEIRRAGRSSIVEVARVARPAGLETIVLERPTAKIICLRLLTLGSRELPPTRLRQIWEQVIHAQSLVLDLRNCVGGDSKVSNFIAGSFLGPSKRLFRTIPRPGSKSMEVLDQTDPQAPRFGGGVAVITNSNTESQPEMLAAICREYGCARVVGERTAGAFNGWTVAVDLPYSFAKYALPFARSVSPNGVEYEGRGVEPDEPAVDTVEDFAMGHDRPLLAALRCLGA
jgi:C-terminal processing protease CtpA/Prc